MRPKNFIYNKNINGKLKKEFLSNYNSINKEIVASIDDSEKTLNILNKNYKFNFNLNDLKKFKKFKKIAIVGMGGSILGTEAIYNFLKFKIKKKVYFFNNLDNSMIVNFEKTKNNNTLFIIISKSGNTIETLTNLSFLKILKNKSKSLIIISEKKDNVLYSLVKKFNLFFIEHKKTIGGRYSVLSEVGIVPAFLMGLDILQIRRNIRKYISFKEKGFLKDSVIKLACILKEKKLNNLIFLNYCPELEKFLYWCQQLVAESLGKNNFGYMPIISNVPKDHHSLLQLYLDGPKKNFFYIFSSKENLSRKINYKNISKIKYLNQKTLDEIKDAQKSALIKSLLKKKISFREFVINKKDEKTIGELFSYFILETIFVGKLVGINPFNQPAVEQVKIFTKMLLK